MKQVFFFAVTILSLFTLSAQTVEKAKEHLTANRIAEAKSAIDEVLKSSTSQTNADAWYIKAKVYNAVANNAVLEKQYPTARMDAFKALKKYTELDKAMLVALQIDGYKPINEIYTSWYQSAANNFNNKNYSQAYEQFTNAILASNFMTEKGWINLKLDTNSVLYAGVSAEKLARYDDAAKYYGQLAENKVKGEGFVEIYKWVANHHFQKKNKELTTKYLMLGREMYPSDPFWNSLDLDIERESGNKNALFAQYEKVIAAEPANHLFRYNYAVELYQQGYNADATKRPADSKVLIEKAALQLTKAVQLKPDYAKAQLFAGQIYYNEGVDFLSNAKLLVTPADATKKAGLKVQAMAKFDQALPYFQAVERLLEQQGKLKAEDKADLKEAYDLMTTIYDQKGAKDKVKEYELKFNDVDRKH